VTSDRTDDLIGWDSARVIREAQRQITEARKLGRRMAEVDDPTQDVKMTVNCMAFEEANGQWRLETIGDELWKGCGTVKVRDREAFLVAEMRYELARRLLEHRVCGTEAARKVAAEAIVLIQGRVPYNRIVSK